LPAAYSIVSRTQNRHGAFWRGIAAVKDRLVSKGYRFGTLKKPFAEYYDMVYFDMAGFEGVRWR
jgi:hypothetical protein